MPADWASLVAICAACHGPLGHSANPQVPSLAGQPKLFVENQLVLIREGLRVVPEMKGLLDGVDDATIIELAKYFSQQKPPAAAATPRDAASFERGKAIASRTHCGSCHLPDFRGQQQVPRVAGQHEQFLLATMKQLRDHPGPGRDTIMAASLRGLTDRDLADVAHFLAHSD
ncbi:c-type cytochrome [Ramlibacter albus]|uniref:C-type cytochrome n=1 Tax=Ramlibacter albus TaxID=2079448 RepID=A0A923S7P7_9BURK|nr:c-type cytochrome [Ramlibacter albus]MBC5767317.1 c-type cytochrome [Ramlibacter albus]